MGGLQRENVCFSLKWGICKEKTRNIRLNGGCSKRKRDFRLNVVFLKRKRVIFRFNGVSRRETACFSLQWGIFKKKTRDFCINGGFSKRRDFRLNGGFAKRKRVILVLNVVFLKRKRVIFGFNGVSQRENV